MEQLSITSFLNILRQHLGKLLLLLIFIGTIKQTYAQWQQATSNTTQTLVSVDYGSGQWVAVGDNGTVVTSTNGMTWTPQISNITNTLREVRYNAGQWIAVGDNGTILTSTDGVNWVSRTSNTNQDLIKVSYSGTKWVTKSLSYNNNVLTSVDGVTWVNQTLPINAYDIASGDGKWVAAARDNIMISLDEGVSWQIVVAGFRFPQYNYANYKNGRWAVVENYVNSAYTSSDGVNWKTGRVPLTYPGIGPRSITYGNGKWMAVAPFGQLAVSEDGVNWSTTYDNVSTHSIKSTSYGGGQWVATGINGIILYNPNPTVAPLPVSLVNFQGRSVANDIQLNWETNWEKGASHFLVEGSRDAKSFEAIGKVNAKGTSATNQHYDFLHKDLSNGLWYYRLRQVDIDGTFTYSQIIAVRVGTEPLDKLTLSPNPSSGALFLENKAGISSVKIYSSTGTFMHEELFYQATTQWSWDGTSQLPGVYLIKIRMPDGKSSTLRWVKQ